MRIVGIDLRPALEVALALFFIFGAAALMGAAFVEWVK
jgi:hypothetical protein